MPPPFAFEIQFDPHTTQWLASQAVYSPGVFVNTNLNLWFTDAAYLFEKGIRSVLGRNATYTISPDYARWKRDSGIFAAGIRGKDPDRPLILSGALYYAIRVLQSGSSLTVGIEPRANTPFLRRPAGVRFRAGRRTSANINTWDVLRYGPYWEGKTHFMELGIAAAMPVVVRRFRRLIVAGLNSDLGNPQIVSALAHDDTTPIEHDVPDYIQDII